MFHWRGRQYGATFTDGGCGGDPDEALRRAKGWRQMKCNLVGRPVTQDRLAARTTALRKYWWTADLDEKLKEVYGAGGRGALDRAAKAIGFPRHQISKRCAELGIRRRHPEGRRPWTTTEVDTVRRWSGKRSAYWIARKIGRTETAVVVKQKRMKLSRHVKSGFTLTQVAVGLGVDHKVVAGWIRDGSLKAEYRLPANRPGQPPTIAPQKKAKYIKPDSLVDFIRKHPTAFALVGVQQEWFLELVLGLATCGLCSQEIKGAPAKFRELDVCAACAMNAAGVTLERRSS